MSNLEEFISFHQLVRVQERKRDLDGLDLLLTYFLNNKSFTISFEAKDRKSFPSSELVSSAKKLLRDGNQLGILVVRGCNQYWGNSQKVKTNIQTLLTSLSSIEQLGKVYLISSSLVMEILEINPRLSGRLLIIKVPASSLRKLKK